jgi:hypothetical protein
MEESKQFSAICLFDFMVAIHNYDMFNHKLLIKYATHICYSFNLHDTNEVINSYKKFDKYICKHELYGTSDLTEPITKVYNKAKTM